MKQFLVALAVLLAACSSTGHDSALDPSTHSHHGRVRVHEPVAPVSTLLPDEFDAAAPISVAEAAKAAAGSAGVASHPDHAARGAEATAIYACPMHPEVTSATPGKCPKCGMSLIKRDKQ